MASRQLGIALGAGLKQSGVKNRPEVDDPSKQDKPEYRGQAKLQDRHQQPALEQLPQAWNEETAKRGKHISS
jgi:hypothetical protein